MRSSGSLVVARVTVPCAVVVGLPIGVSAPGLDDISLAWVVVGGSGRYGVIGQMES
jgi:hypothetical protein